MLENNPAEEAKTQAKTSRFFTAATSDDASLGDVNGSVSIPKNAGFWRTLFAFSGPGALVAVGYMDPGNWVTSIVGGAQYGYLLGSVILLSSLIAMLLQYMSAKLGIVTQQDLAQATRSLTNKPVGIMLWIIAELAIMATDIAEVIGAAIALNLLFNIPLVWGVALTILDVFLLLFLTKLGFRKIEAIVITLIIVILGVFTYEVWLANPDLEQMVENLVPHQEIFMDKGAMTLALGIIGATVMPHNLYLHSSLSQTRKINRQDDGEVKQALKFSAIDSNIQLTIAFIINMLLLLVGAAMFFGRGDGLETFRALYDALQDPTLAGAIASPLLSTLFAIALLASGQNSTITGTLTGQIVMEGFIHLKMPVWARRLLTRLVAIVPVMICTIMYGGNEHALDTLMVNSQVFLSIALPFSMVPLVYFTSSKKYMGEYANGPIIKFIAWTSVVILIGLDLYGLPELIAAWF